MPMSLDPQLGITFSDGSIQSTPGYTGFRNLLHNGDFSINQRYGTSIVGVNNSRIYIPDRWFVSTLGGAGTGQLNCQTLASSYRSTTGHLNAAKLSVTGTKTVAGTDIFGIEQRNEGVNCSHLNYGLANARTCTASFWVTASIAGTYSFGVSNHNGTRSYVVPYTVLSPNTPTYVSIVIPGDTTGSWLTDTGIGMVTCWDVGSGPTYTTSNTGVWQSGIFLRAAGTVSMMSTLNATFEITGCQFEVGGAPTRFETRPYAIEMSLCYRYYFRRTARGTNERISTSGMQWTATTAHVYVEYPVPMRTFPIFGVGNVTNLSVWDGANLAVTAITPDTAGYEGYNISVQTSGGTPGRSIQLTHNGSTTPLPYIEFSADV